MGYKDIIDTIDRRIQTKIPLLVAEAVVVSVSSTVARVRLLGNRRSVEAYYDIRLPVSVQDSCVVVRPATSTHWIIVSAFSKTSNREVSVGSDETLELSPPSGLTLSTALHGVILAYWSAPEQQDVTFEVQTNTSAVESGATTYIKTRGSYAIIPTTSTLYVRVRSISNTFQTSSWTDWGSATGIAAGSVTSVAMTVPGAILSVAGSPITSSGTLALSLISQTANRVFAAPNGSNGNPSFRALVSADIPAPLTITLSDSGTAAVVNALLVSHNSSGTPAAGFGTGFLLEGKSSSTNNTEMALLEAYWSTATHASRKARLDISVYDTAKRVAISLLASGSVPQIGVLGATPVSKQTITGDRYGNTGLASFLTALASFGWITDSTTDSGLPAGGVTSVGLAAPAEFSISGSPVTSTGTLTLSWASESQNYVFAGPASGGAGSPAFRALVDADGAAFPVLAPGSSTRNVIQPGGDFKPLVIKGSASQTANLQDWQDSSGNVLASITSGGSFRLIYSATDARIQFGTNLNGLYIKGNEGLGSFALYSFATELAFFSSSIARFVGALTLNSSPIIYVSAGPSQIQLQTGFYYWTISNTHSASDAFEIINTSASGSPVPLSISKTGLTTIRTDDAGTNAVVDALTVGHNTSGTPAAGFGTGILLKGQDSTTASQQMAHLSASWVVATHASRTARLVLGVNDSGAEREAIRIEASGSAAMIGLFGVTAVARPTTAGAAATFVANTSGIVDDSATFGGYTLGQVVQALQNLGILT